MSADRFLEELRSQVLDAADRAERASARPPRSRAPRSRAPRWLAAAAAVAVVVGGVVLASPRGASADVEVIRQGGHLVIKLTDVETRPDEIEQAASEAGLDVAVDEVPVGASNVGRFIGSSATPGVEFLHVQEGNPASAMYGFTVPIDFAGQLRLQLGRPAEDGEAWAASSLADAPGEVLACEHLFGRTLRDVLSLVQQRRLPGTRVFISDGPGEIFNAELPEHLDATVIRVSSIDARGSVMIDAVDDAAAVPPWTEPTEGCG